MSLSSLLVLSNVYKIILFIVKNLEHIFNNLHNNMEDNSNIIEHINMLELISTDYNPIGFLIFLMFLILEIYFKMFGCEVYVDLLFIGLKVGEAISFPGRKINYTILASTMDVSLLMLPWL